MKSFLKKTSLGLGVALLGATALAGPANAVEKQDGKFFLIVAGRQPISTLDPAQKYDYSSRMVEQAVYDGLVKYEGNPPEIKPWLAKSWSVSDDGLEWTFHLVKDAKFHNGDPLTASDVVYSYKRTLGLKKGPAWMLSDFLSADNITAVDDYTVKFKLNRPYSAFLSFLPWWFVVNPKQVEANIVDDDAGQAWLNENEAGSGPYKLAKFEQGKAYRLDRVADYWKGFEDKSDKMGGIIYKLVRESASQRAGLLKGEIDIATDLTPEELQQVSKNKDIDISKVPALTAFGLKFNTTSKYLSDLNIRKALAYSFDYDGFIKVVNGEGKLQTSPFTDAIRGHVNIADMPRQDLDKAKEFMAKSAYPDGGFELEYVYVQGFEIERQFGLLMSEAFNKLNVTVKMVPLTWPNMVGRAAEQKTSPDVMAVFATPVSTDPDAVAIQYHPSSFGKYYGSHYLTDKALDELIEEARKETDWEKRAPIYAEIQQKIVDLQPEIFGLMRNRTFAYRDWVKGFQDSPIRMTGEIDLYPLYIKQ